MALPGLQVLLAMTASLGLQAVPVPRGPEVELQDQQDRPALLESQVREVVLQVSQALPAMTVLPESLVRPETMVHQALQVQLVTMVSLVLQAPLEMMA